MDSSIETGDPWEIPDPEPESSPLVGGLSPLAEATGLFSRTRSVPAEPEDSPAPTADEEEPQADEEATQPEEVEDSPESGLDSGAGLFDSTLQEREEPPAFDLIPPSSFEPEMSEVFPASTQAGDEPVDDAGFAPTDERAVAPIHPPATPVYQPPADIPLDPWADSVDEAEEPVEIEFGAPQAPEGSELPTGKATVTAGEGTISRPVLLTTETVEGANVAPVDMVVAVESVGDPSAVPAAIERALEALRDRCAEVGGEAVVGVTTSISNTGAAVTVVVAGTAVNLL